MSSQTILPGNWKKKVAYVYSPAKKDKIKKKCNDMQGLWIREYGERSPQEVWIFYNNEKPRKIDKKHINGIWGYKPGLTKANKPTDIIFFPPNAKLPSTGFKQQGIWMYPLIHLEDEINKLKPNTAGFLKVGNHVSKDENLDVGGQWNMLYKTDELTMYVNIVTPIGKKFTLQVQKDDTINELKQKILNKEKIPKNQQRLYFQSTKLDIVEKTLEQYNIKDGDTLNLKPMQIKVIDSTGQKFSLDVTPNDTIQSVKSQIEKKHHIPKNTQRLSFDNESLEDRKTLQYYNIEHNDTLHLGPMQIKIKNKDTGKITKLNVTPDDTIDDIKDLIEQQTNIPFDVQKLYFNGKDLNNDSDNKTLKDYNIKHNDCIDLSTGMSIRIKDPNGNTFLLNDVNPNDTIDDIKNKIEQLKDIPKNIQRLLYDDDLLNDNMKLKDYGIKNNGILDLEFLYIIIEPVWNLNERFIINVSPTTDKINDIKKKIKKQTGISKDQQYLSYNGKSLDNKLDKTLKNLKISHQSIIHLDRMSIIVEDFIGRQHTVYVKPNDTIEDIKNQLEDIDGLPPMKEQILYYNNEELTNNKSTLSDNNIQNKSILKLEKDDGPTYQIEMTNWQNPMMQEYAPKPKEEKEGKRDKSNIYAYLYEGPNAKKKPWHMK